MGRVALMNGFRVLAAMLLGSIAGAFGAEEAEEKPPAMKCALDGLVAFPQVWKVTPEQLEKEYAGENGRNMKWLTADKTRAKFSRKLYSNQDVDLTLLEGQLPIEEAVIDFSGGVVNMITFSIFNRGDGGEITDAEFDRRYKLCGAAMSKGLAVKPAMSKADKGQGLLAEGFRWYSSTLGTAVLEHNEGIQAGAAKEFLRLRIVRKGATGALAASLESGRPGAARLSDLPRNVKKDGQQDVTVAGLPMVDQGNKGYCLVASVQRLFEYYGLGADMHQLAAVAGSDPQKGTNMVSMAKELDKIDYRFKTRLKILAMTAEHGGLVHVERDFIVGKPVDEAEYLKMIRTYVNDGLPLLWGLELGRFPELPKLEEQTAGGHMRVITGYNDSDKTVIFSDSWGAGHERKKMKMEDAYRATLGLFALTPTVR